MEAKIKNCHQTIVARHFFYPISNISVRGKNGTKKMTSKCIRKAFVPSQRTRGNMLNFFCDTLNIYKCINRRIYIKIGGGG